MPAAHTLRLLGLDEQEANALRPMLAPLGPDIVVCARLRDGLEAMASDAPCIAFVDLDALERERMSLDALRDAASQHATSSIVLLTSDADAEQRMLGDDIAPLEVLRRPLHVGVVRSTVRRICESHRRLLLLQDAHSRLSALAESVPHLVWTAQSSGLVDYYNSRRGEYDGIEPNADGNYHWDPVVHPDDVERTRAAWQQAASHGESYACEHRLRMRDGSFRWHLSRARPVRHPQTGELKWFGTATDIHDMKRAEHELRRANVVLGAVYQSTQVLVAVKDRESRIVYANPAVINVAGCGEDHVYGHNDIDWFGAELGGEIVEHDRLVMATGCTHTYEEHTPDGTVWLSTKTPWRGPDGEIRGVVVVSHDLTEHRRAAARLEESEARSVKALEEMKRALLLRDQLSGLVSHDLRNPVSAIAVTVDALRRKLERRLLPIERLDEALQRIARNTAKMENLINELQDMARIQAGEELLLERARCDLVVLCRDVVSEQQLTTGKHRLVLTADGPLDGSWDRERIERLLQNLLSNAIKYSPEGGDIIVDLRRVREDGQDVAVIAVRDSGLGIPESDLSSVFEWFARGHNTTHIRGSGLGLAGARAIAERHGGSLQVESHLGEGSTFTLRLPLDEAPRVSQPGSWVGRRTSL